MHLEGVSRLSDPGPSIGNPHMRTRSLPSLALIRQVDRATRARLLTEVRPALTNNSAGCLLLFRSVYPLRKNIAPSPDTIARTWARKKTFMAKLVMRSEEHTSELQSLRHL